ncbi:MULTISPECIES: hypothetical protein [unclassified Neisseria]|uniref:hypothetical protein n=1 Tax=unclassified Neisseria TaxID=2623750 RepID=UPI002666410D|nr:MULTISPECIES: hypothetical protein [unclassified Neisseria]MDO1510034.1 hypothetical protein [Neisseria sp. MVDL19-042950]MDO1516936.1 hypothetical protein [Neisseria sp. MVDL18-041461]MDO1564221.1 hypothetical protein [Neisseria sp. MVDL20-010259]
MKLIRHLSFGLIAGIATAAAWAENAPAAEALAETAVVEEQPVYVLIVQPQPTPETPENNTWVDRRRKDVQTTIRGWAHAMDDWFGTPDPNDPASANLRILIDTEWNRYDDFSVKPRIRGKVKLPVLQKRLNVVFGDDSLDNQPQKTGHLYDENIHQNKTFDKTQTRESNSSLALRWSDIGKYTGIDTDADIGIRSGNDLYVRLKGSKDWRLGGDFNTRLEQIYRYGIDSKHYVRTNWEVRHAPSEKPFIANHLHVQYANDEKHENWSWGNSLYRQHDFPKNKRLNYGVYSGGEIKNKKAKLNSYGPFVSWRQPVWREWLFVQTELNYLNNRNENRSHHPGVLVRVEALF